MKHTEIVGIVRIQIAKNMGYGLIQEWLTSKKGNFSNKPALTPLLSLRSPDYTVGDFRKTHGGFSTAMFEHVRFLIHPLLADQEVSNCMATPALSVFLANTCW